MLNKWEQLYYLFMTGTLQAIFAFIAAGEADPFYSNPFFWIVIISAACSFVSFIRVGYVALGLITESQK